MSQKSVFFLIFFIYIFASVQAKNKPQKIGRNFNERIRINFHNDSISPSYLPFDIPFSIEGEIPDEVSQVSLIIRNKKSTFPDIHDGLTPKATLQDSLIDTLKTYKTIAKVRKKARNEYKQSKLVYDKKAMIPIGPLVWKKDYTETWDRYIFENNGRIKRDQKGKAVTRNDSVNLFVINIPPLKFCEEYIFEFKFTISLKGEKNYYKRVFDVLSKNSKNSMLGSGKMNDNDIKCYQKILRVETDNYFSDKNIENASKDSKLDTKNFADFKQLFESSNTNYALSQSIVAFKSMNKNFEQITTVAARQAYQGLIGKNLIRDLIYKIEYLNSISNRQKELKDNLHLINIQNGLIQENIAKSKQKIGERSSLSYQLIESTITSHVETYKSNAEHNLEFFQKLIYDLEFIGYRSEDCLQISLGTTRYDTYKKLVSKTSLSTSEKSQFDSMLKEADDFYNNNIVALKSELRQIVTKLGNAYADVEKYKVQMIKYESDLKSILKHSITETNLNIKSSLSSSANFFTRTGYYVSADVGVAYLFLENDFSNKVVPYYGVNFHLGAINKQAKYSLFRNPFGSFGENLYKNTSIIIGLTIQDIDSTNGNLDGAVSNKGLLTGIGLRISDPVRISGGVVWNNVKSDNPLIDEHSLNAYPYVSLSFDVDVFTFLGNIGKALFPNP